MMKAAAVLAAVLPLSAQLVEVRSEFLRTSPRGEILTTDATPQPRELLSPAVARNAFASFHVVVQSPRINYFLFIGSNPDNVFQTTVYEEEFVRRGQDWVPDLLKPVRLPHFGVLPDPVPAPPEHTARSYLLDVWVPADARPGRVRLEIQVKAGTWTIWPMELRILPAVAPPVRPRSAHSLPPPELRADESAMAPLLDYIGRHGEGPGKDTPPGGAAKAPAPPRTLRDVIRRNAEQDMGLARTLDPRELVPQLKRKLAAAGGGEWYLGVRDVIYRMASR